MVEESSSGARAAEQSGEPLSVRRWGPALLKPQTHVLVSSFPFSFAPALLCIVLGMLLAFVQHWAWFLTSVVASGWLGRFERRILAPFRIQPLHPTIVSDAARNELAVLLRIEENDGQLFVELVRIRDTYSMRWLRRFQNGQRLLMGFVRHDNTLRLHRVEAITRKQRALRAAYGAIPSDAWRALEAADRGFDPRAEPGIQRIAIGPGHVDEPKPNLVPVEWTPAVTERREAYRTFASLAEVGPLALDQEQSARIRRARSRQLQVAALCLAGAALGPGLMYVSARSAQAERADSTLLSIAIVALLATLPLLFRAFASWSLARRYAKDLAAGELDAFSGRINVYEAAFADTQQAFLLERNLLSTDPQRLQSVAIGRVSRRVWLANGGPVAPRMIAQIASIAPVPEDAVDQPLPSGLSVDLPAGWRMKRRAFTAQESAELARHVARFRRIGLWNALLLAGPLLLVVFFAASGEMPWPRAYPLLVLSLLGWLGMVGTALWRQRISRALERDRAGGFCLVLLPSYSQSLAHPELRREHLPESRRLWAQMGRPAPWRSNAL